MNDFKVMPKGSLAVSFAYVCWGMLTLFWNMLAKVDSLYILAQRVIWSMVFIGLYALLIGKGKLIVQAIKKPRLVLLTFLCGILVTANWGVYIYAVNSGHVLDASLGYFVEPVLVMLLGVICFREKPSRCEKITFCLSMAGLVYLTVTSGSFPVLALVIAGTFAVYGAVKKKVELDPYTSLFLETLWMTPFALAFTVYAESNGSGAMGVLEGWQWLLLPACGVITGIPLLMFNIGVQKIPYYLSGILMYLNPTLQFLMGLFYFHEALDTNRLIAFVIIWIGVGFTLFQRMAQLRRNGRTQPGLPQSG